MRDKLGRFVKGNKEGFQKGHQIPKEWRENLSKLLKGRKRPDISRALKGRKLSEETKEKIRKNSMGFWLGKTLSKEIRKKMKLAHIGKQAGKNNPGWRGDLVSYSGLHGWVRRNLPKPDICSICKRKVKLEVANISGLYKRSLKDFEWLCRSCHMKTERKSKIKAFEKRRQLRCLKSASIAV